VADRAALAPADRVPTGFPGVALWFFRILLEPLRTPDSARTAKSRRTSLEKKRNSHIGERNGNILANFPALFLVTH
jgi:hypothetical protein